MQQFIENNWLSLLSILIGIVVAYTFYRFQKKGSASASQERKKHASNELLDVVESYIINKQTLSDRVIDNLIFASERDHAVQLRPACTAISLLQDVALRLQRSRHLDIPQKSEYSLNIEKLIQEIRNRSEPAPLELLTSEIRNTLTEIEALVPEENRENARKRLASLAMLSERERELSSKRIESTELVQLLVPTMAGLLAVFATVFIGSRTLLKNITTPLSSVFGKLFPLIVGGLVLSVVILQVVLILLRIRRRSQETYQGSRHDED